MDFGTFLILNTMRGCCNEISSKGEICNYYVAGDPVGLNVVERNEKCVGHLTNTKRVNKRVTKRDKDLSNRVKSSLYFRIAVAIYIINRRKGVSPICIHRWMLRVYKKNTPCLRSIKRSLKAMYEKGQVEKVKLSYKLTSDYKKVVTKNIGQEEIDRLR